MILFCIPHAGGTAAQYFKWKNYLNPRIEILPLELPGHMMRSKEPLEVNCDKVVYNLLERVKMIISTKEQPYAIWGHSMGAILNYFLNIQLMKEDLRLPVHLFVSGYWAPHKHKELDDIDLNDDDLFEKYVLELGGVDQSIIENKSLFQYFITVIKADFRVMKSVREQSDITTVFNNNLTFLYGSEEIGIKASDIEDWKKYTGAGYSSYCIDGAHFFPFTNVQQTVDKINYELSQYL